MWLWNSNCLCRSRSFPLFDKTAGAGQDQPFNPFHTSYHRDDEDEEEEDEEDEEDNDDDGEDDL